MKPTKPLVTDSRLADPVALAAALRVKAKQRHGSPFLVVSFDQATTAQYQAAEFTGDRQTMDDLIEQSCGHRPGPDTELVLFLERTDGPQ